MSYTMDDEIYGANGSPSSNQSTGSTSQTPNSNLAIFCREVRNLLRSKPNCMIPFSKFVPAYHNHYGRQCCVYQFGYTKLIELLEAIPHVVQILADGTSTNRYITLTHREQIKRFASDLIKVVKSQPGKKLRLSRFAQAYEQVLGRVFRVEDYGTNNINVLLAEIWEGTINIIPINRESIEQDLLKTTFRGNNNGNNNNNNNNHEGKEAAEESNKNEDGDHDENEDDDDDGDGDEADRQQSNGIDNGQRAGEGGARPLVRPLFVDVPLSRNNPILEQLVAANELVNKPYITDQHPDCWFEIPRRERSDKEIKRTKYFIWDCIELLSRMKQSQYAVPFSKFIPAYHYYFNRQCKVSIFGFSKLIDLFESISPNVVEIIDQGPGEEKLIRLARKYWPKQTAGKPMNATRRPYSRGSGDYVIMSSSSFSQRKSASQQSERRSDEEAKKFKPDDRASLNEDDGDEYEEEEEEEEDEEVEVDDNNNGDEDEEDEEEEFADDEELDCGQYSEDDARIGRKTGPIDSGPTEEELLELEDELKAYEELQAIQRKRSGRMAAILDIFKYSIY